MPLLGTSQIGRCQSLSYNTLSSLSHATAAMESTPATDGAATQGE